jgi:DNA-binding NarL/FixJ family response regulator
MSSISKRAEVGLRRRHDILTLVALGCTNREIASRMLVTTNTIKYHLKKLFKQHGLRRRSDALEVITPVRTNRQASVKHVR